MPRLNRRGVIFGTGAALVAGVTAGIIRPAADDGTSWHELPPDPDPEQRFVRLIAAGDGVIYGIQANGLLTWMRHIGWREGNNTWANDAAARIIGVDWLRYRWVLASPDGQLFGIGTDGSVTWHRYNVTDSQTGAGAWAPRSGSLIAESLGPYTRFFGGWGGVIYSVGPKWTIWRHRYLAGDGSADSTAWARGGKPTQIGEALSERSFAGPDGAIYDIKDGQLLWRRHTGGDAAPSWSGAGKPVAIGVDWADQRWVMAAEDGVIYSVDNARGPEPVRAEQLTWYRYENPAKPSAVAESFTIEPLAALQGYSTKLSAGPGEELGLAVSTGHPQFSVSVVRLASGTQQLGVVSSDVSVPGRLQYLSSDYREQGCRWTEDHRITIDPDWQSGFYAARLRAAGGWQFDIPFAVRPGNRKAPIAYLWPTNTYNAYNTWGGHNQYTPGRKGKRRTLSFLRPSAFNNIDGPPDRRLTGDLILLRWLSEERIPFDCYHDGDLNGSGDWLWGYRALVLAMHPEYWSEEMRSRLIFYLAHGGCVIYLGGNGIYERVQFSQDKTALTFRASDGQRDLYRNLGKPEHDILSVGYHAESHGTLAPYRVLRDHPLLAGTGLHPGDLFGGDGVLGAASGWEVDRRDQLGGATADQVIAEGQNPRGGAEMIFRPDPGGGWVFSAGSNTFTAAIPSDATIRRILRNVFDLAVKN